MKTLNYIKKYAEKVYNINDISTKSRDSERVKARALYSAIARGYYEYPYTEIAGKINRGHPAIIHLVKKVHSQYINFDKEYKRFYHNFIKFEIDKIEEVNEIEAESYDDLKFLYVNLKQDYNNLLDEMKKQLSLRDDVLNDILDKYSELDDNKKEMFVIRTNAMLKMLN